MKIFHICKWIYLFYGLELYLVFALIVKNSLFLKILNRGLIKSSNQTKMENEEKLMEVLAHINIQFNSFIIKKQKQIKEINQQINKLEIYKTNDDNAQQSHVLSNIFLKILKIFNFNTL